MNKSLPTSKYFHEQHHLPEVIGIVICNQHRFAKDRLPGSMRNILVKIDIGIEHELFHRIEIMPKRSNTRLPCRPVLRSHVFGPITFGPFRRLVTGVTTKLKNVPLRDADVLEEFPKRPRCAFRLFRKIFERQFVESCAYFDMSLSPVQEFYDVFTETAVVVSHE